MSERKFEGTEAQSALLSAITKAFTEGYGNLPANPIEIQKHLASGTGHRSGLMLAANRNGIPMLEIAKAGMEGVPAVMRPTLLETLVEVGALNDTEVESLKDTFKLE